MAVTSIARVTDANGAQINVASSSPYLSPDGTKVLFTTSQSLVSADTNGSLDVYLKNLVTGAVTLVSANAAGNSGVSGSTISTDSIRLFSPDGSKVLFTSSSDNLVPGDTNTQLDLFAKNLVDGSIVRVNTKADGSEATNGQVLNTTYAFTADGRVVFGSSTNDLVAGDTNGVSDYFLKNLTTGAITRISTDSNGNEITGSTTSAVLSPDGTKLAFVSFANDLVAGDTNGVGDLFLKNLNDGSISRINTRSDGGQANNTAFNPPVFSPDGTKVLFASNATNLVDDDTNGVTDIFLKDLATGALTRVSLDANGGQLSAPATTIHFGFTADSRSVYFGTPRPLIGSDTNGNTDFYVRNLATGAVDLVTTNPSGVSGNGQSSGLRFTPDGTVAVFVSGAGSLVPGDTNNVSDVFVVKFTPFAPAFTPAVVDPTPAAPVPSVAAQINSYQTTVLGYYNSPLFPQPATVTTPTGQVLPNPMLEQQRAIAALIAKVDAGTLTLKAAQDIIVDMADGTTSVASLTYQFFTGKTPTKDGLSFLVSSPLNPSDLNDGAYAGMTVENRYINFALNLGKTGEGRASFEGQYGSLSIADATARAYQTIFGNAPDAAKVSAILTPERLAYFNALGGDSLGAKAAMVGFLLSQAALTDTGPLAANNEAFLYDMLDGTAAFGASLDIYGPQKVGLIGVAEGLG